MSSNKKVIADFCRRFPKYRNNETRNEERIAYMLQHPSIRSKLDEWIEGNTETNSDPRRGKNVRNLRLDNDDDENVSLGDTVGDKHKYDKTTDGATEAKEAGNRFFKDGKLNQSLSAYNQAIHLASFSPIWTKDQGTDQLGTIHPHDQNDTNESTTTATGSTRHEEQLFPILLANRSAVYYELGFYDAALEDANLALAYNYPDRLKSKLFLRKANIYIQMKEWDLAEKMIQEIKYQLSELSASAQTPSPSKDMLVRIKELEDKIRMKDELALNHHQTGPNKSDCKPFLDNEKLENGSISLETAYSDKTSRCVKAATDLKKGDVLFQEQPFASVLLPQFYQTHCHHCHRTFKNYYSFPCHKCSQVKYCSAECGKSSWNLYHKDECLYLDLLHSVGIGHLAIRISLTAGVPSLLKALHNDHVLTDTQNNRSLFRKGHSNYERVYSLLHHFKDMELEDIFQYTLTASLLTNWMIKKTSRLTGLSTEDEIGVGAVVLHHICQLICNAHAITDVLSDIQLDKVSLSTSEESQLRIATAIFPAASLMNHSCDPNITFGFVNGKTLIVKAVKDIKCGHEVFNCYGPHFRRMNQKTRKEALRDQYFFDCTCKPCVQESNGTSFVDTFLSFKCSKCEGAVVPPDPETCFEDFSSPCRDCGEINDLEDSMKACIYTDRLFQDGQVLLERGNVKEALKIFGACHSQRQRILYKFHTDVGEISDLIGKCYAMIGEFSEAVKWVKDSVDYVEKRFGSDSVESGRELKKYADLLTKVDKDKHESEIKRTVERYQSIVGCNF